MQSDSRVRVWHPSEWSALAKGRFGAASSAHTMRAGCRASELAAGIARGSRTHLARAITLAESTRSIDRTETAALLRALPRPKHPAFRIGISGPPGAGKSSFIEAAGTHLLKLNHRVAVLVALASDLMTWH